jgi:hypothetical protein
VSGLLRRSGQPESEQSDALAVQVAEAQRMLAEGAAKAGLQNDAYGYVLEGLSHTLATFPALAQRIDAARQPAQDHQLQTAVVAGMRGCSAEMIRHNTLRTLLIGAAIALIWTAAVAGSVWWYCESRLTAAVAGIEQQFTRSEAARWLAIMRYNDLAAVEQGARCEPQNGRIACTLAFWTEPPPPAPTSR